ncbi:MAG TPA: serine/threonine-protein kinase, partial [Myxococcota bacterium]
MIKRILPQYSRDLTFVSMFIDEARITINLDHKNVVKLYDFGQSDGTYYMAIEYVDGTDLAALMRAHLQAQRGLAPTLAAFVVRELCAGLHHAHTLKDHNGRTLGIVHRDVSPQNVLLSSSGEVKLTDFGIAAARHKLTLTSPGTVLGKAAYMAPEQATGKPVSYATDVWALGVILHEMLAGDRLFADETPLATVQRVVHDEVFPPSHKNPAVPAALDRIVMRALAKKPSERYPSAEAMAGELSAWLALNPFGEADLAKALASLDWDDDTARMRPSHRALRGSEIERSMPGVTSDRQLESLFAELHAEPDLWTLVAAGDRYRALQMSAPAASAYRTAAAIFAHRGLLVQALCAYDGAKAVIPTDLVRADLVAIGDLSAGNRTELVDVLKRFDKHHFWDLLKDADPGGLGSEAEAPPFPAAPTPLFGSLGPLELARVGLALRVRKVGPGEVVIKEGEVGDALYAVGRGRLVVYCRPGEENDTAGTVDDAFDKDDFGGSTSVEAAVARMRQRTDISDRVYLAGLADGDFFGEFSFLAERPRSATIESITESL